MPLTLDELALKYQTDKGSKQIKRKLTPKNYTYGYEERFGHLRDEAVTLLEIGVAHGGSMKMWEEYFQEGRIFGLDIKSECKKHESKRTKIFIGDQTDAWFLGQIVSEHIAPGMGDRLDIIIDDGGHRRFQQVASFEILFPMLSPGGFYAIEDLQADPSVHGKDPLLAAIVKQTKYGQGKTEILCPPVHAIYFYPRMIMVEKSTYE